VSGFFEGTFAFILMLGVLVTVHEFGHFIVAKWCGVRVLKFSIGFGSPIGIGPFRMRWERNGTEYVVAWIPLGGFVKMLGENPGEEEDPAIQARPEETLEAQSTWKKLAIYAAGPAMNLLLPVLVMIGTLWVGMDRREAVIGTIEPASPALAAGLRSGDRIVSIDGEPIEWWDEVERVVRESPDDVLHLDVLRGDAALSPELRVTGRAGVDLFRRQQEIGWAGMQHNVQHAVVGVVSLASAASRAGLRSGDRVEAVDGRPVGDWTGLDAEYRAAEATDAEVVLTIVRGEEDAAEELEIAVPAMGDLEALGVIPAVVLVVGVAEDSPAAQAGLVPGDLLVSVDGQAIGSFPTFKETVLASGGRPLEVQYARAGETRVVDIRPEKTVVEEIEGIEEEAFRIGVALQPNAALGPIGLDRERNPVVAVPRAVELTAFTTVQFADGLKRLVSGEISRKNLGGPIEIARQSHLALKRGWDHYLRLMVLISINLGILNLLPIPILDGGQMLIATVEGVKRGPLSMRTREFVQQVGVMMLVAIMGFAFWNDLSRHWSTFLEWVGL
jgi:regulator of sigma E protease